MVSLGRRLRDSAGGLLQPGRIEIVLAALLAVLCVFSETVSGQPPSNLIIDLIACGLTVVAVRWPRVGGLMVAAFLVVRCFIPWGYRGNLGEYAPLFTLLGVGMRGDVRLRRLLTVLYLPLMWWVSWSPRAPLAKFAWGLVVWIALVAIVWVVGNAFHAVTEAERKARAAELVIQRQLLARELHDTVARSFTRVTMIAERARLRGQASIDDLATISDTAAAGVDELRLVMNLLRDPSASVEALTGGTSLAEALTKAERTLAGEGFTPTISVIGDLERVDPGVSEALAAAVAEAVANVVRHGDPVEPAGLIVDVGEQRIKISVINSPAADTHSSEKPLGLWGMKQRVEGIGGTVDAGPEDQHWVTTVRAPVKSGSEEDLAL